MDDAMAGMPMMSPVQESWRLSQELVWTFKHFVRCAWSISRLYERMGLRYRGISAGCMDERFLEPPHWPIPRIINTRALTRSHA